MRVLVQRVSEARVKVHGHVTGEIGHGVLLLVGFEKSDSESQIDTLLSKVLNYRLFNDDEGRMNLSLLDVGGELLVVSQFTLVADTKKGLRPSFSSSAPPEVAEGLYHLFVQRAIQLVPVQTGQFGEHMEVSLINQGPATFMFSD